MDFARTDAAAFSLNGFDGATFFPGYTGRIEVVGNFSGGGSVSAFFNLTDAFTSYALPGTFAGLSSVRVRDTFSVPFRGGPGSFSLDNIVYNGAVITAVPEPATSCCSGLDSSSP